MYCEPLDQQSLTVITWSRF